MTQWKGTSYPEHWPSSVSPAHGPGAGEGWREGECGLTTAPRATFSRELLSSGTAQTHLAWPGDPCLTWGQRLACCLCDALPRRLPRPRLDFGRKLQVGCAVLGIKETLLGAVSWVCWASAHPPGPASCWALCTGQPRGRPLAVPEPGGGARGPAHRGCGFHVRPPACPRHSVNTSPSCKAVLFPQDFPGVPKQNDVSGTPLPSHASFMVFMHLRLCSRRLRE